MHDQPINIANQLARIATTGILPANEWPEIQCRLLTPTAVSLDLYIPADLRWFDGHFPDQPILPGVALTHWACLLSTSLFDLQTGFIKLTRLKFQQSVRPEQRLALQINLKPTENRATYNYVQTDTKFSSGTIHFRPIILAEKS